MPVTVEYTDQFSAWWDALSVPHQQATNRLVDALMKDGVNLRHPYSSAIKTSRHPHMRELRVRTRPPIRVFYAFDPRRNVILLIGGIKTDEKRFYERHVRLADKLYDEHLQELEADSLHGHRRHHNPRRGPSR